jgi:hypothetical protein
MADAGRVLGRLPHKAAALEDPVYRRLFSVGCLYAGGRAVQAALQHHEVGVAHISWHEVHPLTCRAGDSEAVPEWKPPGVGCRLAAIGTVFGLPGGSKG